MVPMIGRVLGHYQIVQEIGAGGMGLVYKARDLHLDRFVAIKTLPSEKTSDPERRKRFVQEARAASALNHTNIIHIYDIAEEAGIDFIAMEYVEGQTLGARIGGRGLSLNTALKYAIQIADALAKAHAAGIVHRDLKPSNVMINSDGAVKLLDFGLAKLTEPAAGSEFATTATAAAGENPITAKGSIVGTVAYMSPEQIEGKETDPRSDIFSFGSVLYEMITGRRAFEGANVYSTISAILEKEPRPLGADIPRDLDRIIARCMRKDPARRFQNMADLKVALEELKEESDSHKSASLVASSEAAARFRFSIRNTVLIAVLVAAVVAAVWLVVRSRARRSESASTFENASGGKLTLLVSSAGEVSGPALSPDGKMLAYVADEAGRKDLFAGRVAGGERVRLTDDGVEEALPCFSPDGEHIAYTRLGSESRASEIWIVPALGGQSVRTVSNALDAAWSPDGRRLVFVLRKSNEGDALAMSDANGMNVSVIAKSDALLPFFRTPSWSPDGKLLSATRSSGGTSGELWIVPADGGPLRRLSNDAPGVFSAKSVFTPDGRGLIHQSNRAGATNLWILPLDGEKPVRLTSGPGPDTMASVAHNGAIAFVNARSRNALVVFNLASGRSREVVVHSYYVWGPAFSPDGLELAYSRAEQDGSWHIWTVPLQGGTPRQLTSGALPEVYPRYAPDGGSIVYHTWSPGPDRIWRVPRNGGPPEALTPPRDGDDQYGDISPDGKWIAFARTQDRITGLWIAPMKGGEAAPLVRSASTLPRWSPDGKWIAFSPGRGYIDGLFVIRPDGTGMRRVADRGGWPVWFPDGRQLGYQNVARDGAGEHCAVRLTGGPARNLIPLRFTGMNNPFDISPDGAVLATTTSNALTSDIWLLSIPGHSPARP